MKNGSYWNSENTLKDLFGSKSLDQHAKVVYNFEIMITKLEEAKLKLKELRKKGSIVHCKTSQ